MVMFALHRCAKNIYDIRDVLDYLNHDCDAEAEIVEMPEEWQAQGLTIPVNRSEVYDESSSKDQILFIF